MTSLIRLSRIDHSMLRVLNCPRDFAQKMNSPLRILLICGVVWCFAVLATTAHAQTDRQLPVEQLDPSKLKPPTEEELIENIERIFEEARIYEAASRQANENNDGTPGSASRIALLRLQMLSVTVPGLIQSSGMIEHLQMEMLNQEAELEARRELIIQRNLEIQSELDSLSQKVTVSGNDVVGDDNDSLLLYSKIKTREQLNSTLHKMSLCQSSIGHAEAELEKLDRSIETYSKLLLDETERQQNAIVGNQILKHSSTLTAQANQIFSSVSRLAPVIKSMRSDPAQAVVPEMAPVNLPTSAKPQVTPEIREELLKYLNQQKRTAVAGRT